MVTKPAPQSWPRRVLGFIVGEFLGTLPAMLFFAVGFNVVVLSMNLIVDDYLIKFGGFMTATAAALIVGKAVLVANHARFISRFDRSPLIVPILFKTIIYWLAVLAARIVEAYIHYVISTGRAIGFIPFMWHDFSWRRFVFVGIWMFVLFLAFTTASELNRLIGHGMLYELFFRRSFSDFALTRRQRIRALAEISKLIRHTPSDAVLDPTSSAGAKVIQLIRSLAARTK